ncbi:MAG: SufD family Fe-S cluster assembly protein [Synechococcaceae cyanobacterium]|nr:SufD family Fe-S cluster assembly protein [Synechococcaceae cyanobacterium]
MVAPALSAPPRSEQRQRWLSTLLQQLPPAAGPLRDVQRHAVSRLCESGLPDRRQEAWRFTSLDPLTSLDPVRLAHPPDPVAASWPAPAGGSLRLVLDGRTDPLAGVRLPAGLESIPAEALPGLLGSCLQACAAADDWPTLLNAAAAGQVLALRVTAAVAPVLELVAEAAGPGLLASRVLLLLEPEADLRLLQVQRGAAGSLSSLVLEAELQPGARLLHGLLALGDPGAVLLAQQAVRQQPGSSVSLISASRGWDLCRLQPRVLQAAGEASTRLRGLHWVDGSALADTHSLVRFGGPDGQLDQLHKVVADGSGRSVFDGAVQVPRAAQRTDASQLSRALLLSDRACVDTKPQLEIVADDVRCAHGATISRLQDDQLFYLRSRGVSATAASRLLLRGWCEEVLAELPGAATWRPLQTMLGEVCAP